MALKAVATPSATLVGTLLAPGPPLAGTDSGAVNAYVFTHRGSVAATLAAGTIISFTPLNTNTGASTLNADGTGAVAILRKNGTALSGGEMNSLGPVMLQSTGTQWQIMETAGAQPGFERTAAETSAGITPTNLGYTNYLPGIVDRYGDNTTPGTTDMTTAIKNAYSVIKQSNGTVPLQFLGTKYLHTDTCISIATADTNIIVRGVPQKTILINKTVATLTASVSAISQAALAVITVTTVQGSNPFAVNQQILVTGAAGMTQINGLTGTVTAIGGSSGAWTITVSIASSAFTAYTSGGTVTLLKAAILTTDAQYWDIRGLVITGVAGFPNMGIAVDSAGGQRNAFFVLKDIICQTNGGGIRIIQANTGSIENYQYWPSGGSAFGGTIDTNGQPFGILGTGSGTVNAITLKQINCGGVNSIANDPTAAAIKVDGTQASNFLDWFGDELECETTGTRGIWVRNGVVCRFQNCFTENAEVRVDQNSRGVTFDTVEAGASGTFVIDGTQSLGLCIRTMLLNCQGKSVTADAANTDTVQINNNWQVAPGDADSSLNPCKINVRTTGGVYENTLLPTLQPILVQSTSDNQIKVNATSGGGISAIYLQNSGGTKAQIFSDSAGNLNVLPLGASAALFLGYSSSLTGLQINSDGSVAAQVLGKGFRVKEGANAKQGISGAMTAGSITVANTSVTATSRILLTRQDGGTNPGAVYVSARTAGTSFTITSTNAADTGAVAYEIFEPS